MSDGNPTSYSYYIYIYCSSSNSLILDMPQDQSMTVYKHVLANGKVFLFNLISQVPLSDGQFEVNVAVSSGCSVHPENSILIQFGRSNSVVYDASHYVTSSQTNPFFSIIPAMHYIYPQPRIHFKEAMLLMKEFMNFGAELSGFLSYSDTNIIKFLDQFNVNTPPHFPVGLLIVAKCHSHPFSTPKLSKYLISKMKEYLPFLYKQCIFKETEVLEKENHDAIKSLYRFILANCGVSFAGFFLVAFGQPIVDFDVVSCLEPASATISDADVNIANGELFATLIKLSRGQPLLLPAICASITANLTMRVQPMTEKLVSEWTEFDFRSLDLDFIAAIVSHRLKYASIDYSCQGFFLVIRPLLINHQDFIDKFKSEDHWIPLRHISNFAIDFSVSRQDLYELTIVSIDCEEDVSNLFISSLGNILLLIEGEKRPEILFKFMARTKSVAFSIGEQWREQCTKTIWRGLAEATEEIVEIICRAMGTSVCSLAAGYFSASNFQENEKITEILQRCLVTVLPTIELTPKFIGKEYVNILAILKCEWIITIDPVSLKRIARASQKLVRSVNKKLDVSDQKVIQRFQLLDQSAKHLLSVLQTTFPHIV